MISYQTILAELEKQLNMAKCANSEQQLREAMAATKALCDVVLQMPAGEQKQQASRALHKPFVQEPLNRLAESKVQVLPASTQRLEEDDGANGESLFDF